MIGVLVGFGLEARIAGHLPEACVAVSGANAIRAQELAQDLLRRGAKALLSFGVAGGLDPALRAADLLVAETILWSGGSAASDVIWRQRLLEALPGARLGRLYAIDRIVAEPSEKQALFEACGAHAIDMESRAAAEAAHKEGVPFAAVRAIADPFSRRLPSAVLAGMDAAGRATPARLLRALIGNPAEIPAVVGFVGDTLAALTRLRQAVRAWPA